MRARARETYHRNIYYRTLASRRIVHCRLTSHLRAIFTWTTLLVPAKAFPMPRVAAAVITAIFLFPLLPAACGGGSNHRPARALPPYSSRAAELFDDAIEARAVGYQLDNAAPPPMNDNILRERAQVGDAVVRARVTTITSKDEDKGRTWQIGFHTIEKLGGSGPLDSDFTVQVQPGGPAAGIMRALGPQMMGITFLAFVREFARSGASDDSELHFHLSADNRAAAAAVRSAFSVDKVR
jgi:hypothetical protein